MEAMKKASDYLWIAMLPALATAVVCACVYWNVKEGRDVVG